MEQDNSTYRIPFHVPSFARPAAYAFVAPEDNEVYQELAAISEEIQQCRSKILQNY
ncbi:hypothetical protein FWF89_01280 [Candidatus Saccharibacteria bacterium]|nr:hypothetical protein [Candidatus Saccharibacteria bacterium]